MLFLLMKTLFGKPLDVLILALAVLAVVASFYALKTPKGNTRYAVITAEKHEYLYPLSVQREVHIPGPLGESVIVIADESARFVDSPCENKICIHSGTLREVGDVAACLPNSVLMHIEER